MCSNILLCFFCTVLVADESSLGCYGNVIDYLDKGCSGREECVYPVQDLEDKVEGCYQNDRLRFLDATYLCIQGN